MWYRCSFGRQFFPLWAGITEKLFRNTVGAFAFFILHEAQHRSDDQMRYRCSFGRQLCPFWAGTKNNKKYIPKSKFANWVISLLNMSLLLFRSPAMPDITRTDHPKQNSNCTLMYFAMQYDLFFICEFCLGLLVCDCLFVVFFCFCFGFAIMHFDDFSFVFAAYRTTTTTTTTNTHGTIYDYCTGYVPFLVISLVMFLNNFLYT